MNKNQIFDFIVNKTACVCGVSAEDIKGASRVSDVVDARCMAFRFALSKEIGFSPRDIARLLGKDNPKSIRELNNSFNVRCERSNFFRGLYAFLRSEIKREGILPIKECHD